MDAAPDLPLVLLELELLDPEPEPPKLLKPLVEAEPPVAVPVALMELLLVVLTRVGF